MPDQPLVWPFSIHLFRLVTGALLDAGYWAFGFNVSSFVVSSFTMPTGAIAAIYVFAILQIVGCYQIYCRPTFGFAYNYLLRPLEPVWSLHNVLMRAVVTTVYMAVITLIAAMVPFFGCVCSSCRRVLLSTNSLTYIPAWLSAVHDAESFWCAGTSWRLWGLLGVCLTHLERTTQVSVGLRFLHPLSTLLRHTVLCRFTPMDFILPPVLWLAVGKRSILWKVINWGIIVIYSIIAIAGAIGSVQAIAADVSNYSVFADLF